MRVVITGATGNIGTSTIEAMGDVGGVDEIVGVAKRRSRWVPPKTTWHDADVAKDDLVPVFAGADAVVHLAWLIQPSHDPWRQWETNVVGTERVLAAAATADVRRLVYVSSIGAYSPGPRDHGVDESWPTDGVPTLPYSWQKALVERSVGRFAVAHPEVRVVVLRPALVFKGMAAREIKRFFLGPLVPGRLVRGEQAATINRWSPLQFQAVHSLDVGQALRLAVVNDDARGAFNLAADPVIGHDRFRATSVARGLAALSWQARLQPTAPGWLDLARRVPRLDSSRARDELGWAPVHTATDALTELLDGLHAGEHGPTPALS